MVKEKLKEFFAFFRLHSQHRLNFCLVFIIFSLLPAKNYYTDLTINPGSPPVRFTNINLVPISAYPVNFTGKQVSGLTAASALVIDVPSKAIIFSKNPDSKLFPASTTKIMTALVALDYYQLSEIIEVKNVKRVGQLMGLEENEKITFENLLYGLLVKSGNDAAYSLAQNYSGGVEGFVKAMNGKSQQLHLNDTNFVNPAGLDVYGHLSTTHDLAILAAAAMENPVFRKIVAIKTIEVSDVSGKISHTLENVNQLLGRVEGLQGIKTGRTENAGECLIGYTERNGNQIITVILGSEDRFGETQKLTEWVFANHEWQEIH